jgi:hypothetical protein
VADDALTDAERVALESVMRSLATYAAVIKAEARAEAAAAALAPVERLAEVWETDGWDYFEGAMYDLRVAVAEGKEADRG